MSCSSLSHIATLVSQLVSPFPIPPFIICLIPLHLQLPSPIVVSLHEQWVLWCASPVVWCYSFGYRVKSPCSHGFAIFDIAHIGVWHYLLGDLGLCFPSFHSHFTPGLHYGSSRKTTLRLWDLVSALTRFIWTGSVYWLSMGCWQVSIASGDIEGHILSFHSVCLPQVHDQRQMIQRVGTVEGTFARCFDTFILGHVPILAC